MGAPLLGLPKSIYYYIDKMCIFEFILTNRNALAKSLSHL